MKSNRFGKWAWKTVIRRSPMVLGVILGTAIRLEAPSYAQGALQPVIKWPRSALNGIPRTDIVKYELHRGATVGFVTNGNPIGQPGATKVGQFPRDPPPGNELFSYAHPKDLEDENYYYKVLTFDQRSSALSNEVAVLHHGADTYIFALSFNSAPPVFRAVAGAVLGDAWHMVRLNLNIAISKNGQAQGKEQDFILTLLDNPGHDDRAPKRARIVDVQGTPPIPDTAERWRQNTLPSVTAENEGRDLKGVSITRRTDANGDLVVRVLSAQQVSGTRRLRLQWREEATDPLQVVAEWKLDFARAVGRRGSMSATFGEVEAQDTGWVATPEVLTFPGEIADIKFHLRFQPVPGQWEKVRGHWLEISIKEVLRKLRVGIDSRERLVQPTSRGNPRNEFPDFVYFVNAAGHLINSNGEVILGANGQPVGRPQDLPNYQAPTAVRVQTDNEGEALVHIKANNLIDKVIFFGLHALNTTQFR